MSTCDIKEILADEMNWPVFDLSICIKKECVVCGFICDHWDMYYKGPWLAHIRKLREWPVPLKRTKLEDFFGIKCDYEPALDCREWEHRQFGWIYQSQRPPGLGKRFGMEAFRREMERVGDQPSDKTI